jgi:hypothetical protein
MKRSGLPRPPGQIANATPDLAPARDPLLVKTERRSSRWCDFLIEPGGLSSEWFSPRVDAAAKIASRRDGAGRSARLHRLAGRHAAPRTGLAKVRAGMSCLAGARAGKHWGRGALSREVTGSSLGLTTSEVADCESDPGLLAPERSYGSNGRGDARRNQGRDEGTNGERTCRQGQRERVPEGNVVQLIRYQASGDDCQREAQ